MASTETSQNDNEDTVLSILKDIRDLLRHQEGRIKRLEDDHASTLPESPLKLSKAEMGKQRDSQPPSNDDFDEAGGSTQPTEDQTGMRLFHPSQHLDEVTSTSSSRLPQPQSNSGSPLSNDNVDESGDSNQQPEGQTDMRIPSQHLDGVASTSSPVFPRPQSDSGQQEMAITPAAPPVSEVCK